ncbi:hypothetical protein [Rhodococcus sp. D-1]|uniref:hypothetical protein n=1 Tax=Rhodococcus sp. D-1 TaxID=1912238 RepID=UPI00211609B7|nr:hypothetical protein [Rhodococcus sp. D-1]
MVLGGGEDDWHWTATFAYPENEVPGPHVQYYSARPDQQALDHLAVDLPALVSERQGRYRSRVVPLTVCWHLAWRAVGDPAAVAELLEPIMSIGKKRSAGHGHVLSWEIPEHMDADQWKFAHLHPDDSLGRTATPACMHDVGDVRTGGEGQMGLRPQYMHPVRRRAVVFPVR